MHTQTREKGRDEEKEATCSAMAACPGKGNVIHTGAQGTPGVRGGSLLEGSLAWTRIHRLEPRVTEGEVGTGRDSPGRGLGGPLPPRGPGSPGSRLRSCRPRGQQPLVLGLGAAGRGAAARGRSCTPVGGASPRGRGRPSR